MLVIGDVHGKRNKYLNLIEKVDYSIQIGDFDLDYDWLKSVGLNHRFFGGNHDNYNRYSFEGHGIGDFGPFTLGHTTFFFVRGGLSIDWSGRQIGVDYFNEEELTFKQGLDCLDLYCKLKPDIVLSHEGPESITNKWFGPGTGHDGLLKMWGYPEGFASNTSRLLESLLKQHRPKLWVFGHYHKKRDEVIRKTRFICLPELGAFEI